MTPDPAQERSEASSLSDLPRIAIATFFGSGLSPVAPGTAGSIAACGAYLGIVALGLDPTMALAIGIVLASISCVALGPWYPKYFGKSDPSAVVIDECAGQWIALLPVAYCDDRTILIVAAFLAFRLFDVSKVLGVKRAEAMPGGWGVLMDDILAGVYAALVVVGASFVI